VRLADCGPAYLRMILPALDWFKSGQGSGPASASPENSRRQGPLHASC
jgi:hypothetical protein